MSKSIGDSAMTAYLVAGLLEGKVLMLHKNQYEYIIGHLEQEGYPDETIEKVKKNMHIEKPLSY